MTRPCDYDGRGYDPPYDTERDREDAAIAYKIGERVVELEQQLAACRALLRTLAAKAVRNKFNTNWLEVTLTQDELDAVIAAATERAKDVSKP